MILYNSICFIIITGLAKANFLPELKNPKPNDCENIPGPINIDTTNAKFVKGRPLFFSGPLVERWALNNTGKSVDVYVDQSFTVAIVSGGVLENEIYKWHHFRYFWNDNFASEGHYAYTTIDGGNGTQLEVLSYFYNIKYKSFRNALKYRNGLVAVSSRINVGWISNPQYYLFQLEFKKLKDCGCKPVPVNSASTYLWFANYPHDLIYYSYPGAYFDDVTGKSYDCLTTIVLGLVKKNFISHFQFKDTFGSLSSSSGKPLINVAKQHSCKSVPVLKSKGFALLNVPL